MKLTIIASILAVLLAAISSRKHLGYSKCPKGTIQISSGACDGGVWEIKSFHECKTASEKDKNLSCCCKDQPPKKVEKSKKPKRMH